MKFIKVYERRGASDHTIFESEFDKIAMVTEKHCGFMNINGIMNFMEMAKDMVENFCLQEMDIDDKSDIDDIIDSCVLEAIVGINICMLALGPLGEMLVKEADDDKVDKGRRILDIAESIMDKASGLNDLCKNVNVMSADKFIDDIGSKLMDELEEYEKEKKED